jgi:hypothetical protein
MRPDPTDEAEMVDSASDVDEVEVGSVEVVVAEEAVDGRSDAVEAEAGEDADVAGVAGGGAEEWG